MRRFAARVNVLSVQYNFGYLRKKFEIEGRPRVIQTVRGIGYVLQEE